MRGGSLPLLTHGMRSPVAVQIEYETPTLNLPNLHSLECCANVIFCGRRCCVLRPPHDCNAFNNIPDDNVKI